MNLYKFHTFRTDYYFPDNVKGGEFLYGLYHPYNRYPLRLLAVKVYWWLYRHFKMIRKRNLVINADNYFPYSMIVSMCPQGSILSFNMGTPGPEQKISLLGLTPNGERFFAKYSTKDGAKALSRNEIKVLSMLKDSGLAPELYDYNEKSDYVFFRTSCVEGANPKEISLDSNILDLAIRIGKYGVRDGELKTCLSHGDFTPWNVIVTSSGEYRMIDWEMADERELGYDVFTYVTHVGALLSPDVSALDLISASKSILDKYFSVFGIDDWKLYMKAFAKRRIKYETNKGNLSNAQKYECLL